MIKLYHAPFTRSIRVLWLLEELGLPYDLVRVAFTPGPLPFAQNCPYGKVPAIEDGDVAMMESGAIVEYVLERYGEGRLAPRPGAPGRAEFLQWSHFAEATVLPPVGEIARHAFFKPEAERIASVVQEARARLTKTLELVDERLATRPYLLGDAFSAADVMMGSSVFVVRRLQSLDPKLVHVAEYLARLEARPAAQKALS